MPPQRQNFVPGSPGQQIRLEGVVRDLIATERYEDAVLVAQALLDARIEAVLVYVAAYSDNPEEAAAMLRVLSSYSLVDARVQAFFNQVARIDFSSCCQDELKALERHVERRYGVVHHVELVSREEAEMSLAAVLAISAKVRVLALSALNPEDEVQDDRR